MISEKSIKKTILFLLLLSFILFLTSCNRSQYKAVGVQPNTVSTAATTGTKVNMSADQKKALDTFFSMISQSEVRPFAKGQLSDDDLVSCALHVLGFHGKNISNVSGCDAENLEIKYFGRCVQSKDQQKYFYGNYIYENGIYTANESYSLGSYNKSFAEIDELWDLGNDTFNASVFVYYLPEWNGDSVHEKTTSTWQKAEVRYWTQLIREKYRATIHLVHEGEDEHYTLLEYLKEK